MKTGSRAEDFFRSEDFTSALEEFKGIVNEEPQNVFAHQRIAECYYRLGNYEEAMKEALATLAISPGLVTCHTILAFIHYRQGRPNEGLAEARLAFDLAPESVDALDCLGTILIAQRSLKEGISLLEKARDLDPNRLSVRNNLSLAYRSRNDYRSYLREARFVFIKKPSIKNGLRLLSAWELQHRVLLTALAVLAIFGALLLKLRFLLILPAYFGVRGILISFQLMNQREFRSGFTHLIAYLLFIIFLGFISSLI